MKQTLSLCKKSAIIGGQQQRVLGTAGTKSNARSRVSFYVYAFKESSQLQDWRVKEMVEVRVGTTCSKPVVNFDTVIQF